MSLDELAGLFEQERLECDSEAAAMDLGAQATEALTRAGLVGAPAGDALDLELRDLFSTERAQVMQEAKAALLPTAPGLATSGSAMTPTLVSRVPLVAKWGLGLSCAAGLTVVSLASLEGKSISAWSQERIDAAAALFVAPEPVQMVEPLVEPSPAPMPRAEAVSRAPRLVPQVPKAVRPKASTRPSAKRPSLDETLRRLEAQAQQAWKANDRRGAEQKFKQIIQLAPRSSFAQWAWGDLFLLAKKSKDQNRRQSLWQAYLKAHPKGRFADAAFAGLCASASEDVKNCWREYLKKFPKGAFVKRAKKYE